MESEEHYKDITKTGKFVGGMNGVKSSNVSTSPSPLLRTKDVVE
jgi:hypothetical protein